MFPRKSRVYKEAPYYPNQINPIWENSTLHFRCGRFMFPLLYLQLMNSQTPTFRPSREFLNICNTAGTASELKLITLHNELCISVNKR